MRGSGFPFAGFWRGWAALALLWAGLLLPAPARAVPPESEVKALQQVLSTLGYYKGEVNGEITDTLKAAITRYTQEAGLKGTLERWISNPGTLARDADLEKRIRRKKVKEASRLSVQTRFGELTIVTYRQEGSPPGFADGRRAYLRGERFDAPLTSLSSCCQAIVHPVKDTDYVVLQGTTDQRDCPVARVYVAVEAQRVAAAEGDHSCAAHVYLGEDNDRLIVTARNATTLLEERYAMRPGLPLLGFRGMLIPGSLEPLRRFVGHFPWEMVDGQERFFLFPPLTAALSAILEPEAIGWALKLSQTSPVEIRGNLLFARGTYGQDETAIAILIDLSKEAVHACVQGPDITRMSSTSLRGVYLDPNASCSTTFDESIQRWASLGLLEPVSDAPVFGFEGEYGDEGACKDRNATVKFGSRRLRDHYGEACRLDEVGFAEGRYQLKTSCGLLSVKKLDEDRIEIDGDTYQRCPAQ